MYVKLMLRGLLRHRKSGKRLFILLSLCSLAVMFCLGFRDSFSRRYRELAIDASTAHLQILPPDSPKTRATSFDDHRQGLVLLSVTTELRDFLAGLRGVDCVMPVIETGAALFGLDGESTDYTPSLIGVDPVLFSRMLPAVTIVEGGTSLAWAGGTAEVPLFRPVPEPMWEKTDDVTVFERKNFRLEGDAWEAWKLKAAVSFPALFPPSSDVSGATGDVAFIDAMTAALSRDDLPRIAAPPEDSRYDWKVDDALAALSERQALGTATASLGTRLKAARKKYLQALMSEAIRPVFEGIALDTSYTMAVPPARGDDLLAMPAVIPVRMAAYVQRMPLYFFNFYVDNAVLRSYLGISPDQCTSLMVRATSSREIPGIKAAVTGWLSSRGLDYGVQDSEELGKIFLSTAMAFDVITLIVMLLFIATVIVFVVNTVMLSLIKRRREIGTAIALGLSPFQNAVVMFGEMAVLSIAAWLCAAVVGTVIELVFATSGMPGLIFFPNERMFFAYSPAHALGALGILLPVTLVSTAFALRKLAGVKAVDLLKEAS